LFISVQHAFPAGQTPSADRTTVRFPDHEMTVAEGFRHIESQTVFRFAFSGDKLDVSRHVKLAGEGITVTGAVERLLAGTGHTYNLSQTHFIIVPRFEKAKVTPTRRDGKTIIIPEEELRQFVQMEQRATDSVSRRTVEVAQSFRFSGDDALFHTPGTLDRSGDVPAGFESAPRQQRAKFALKTNLLYGGLALAPNLRAEVGLGRRTTLEGGVSYNGWNLHRGANNNRKLVHGTALVEFRWWFCERFYGHFLGVHALGAFYNVGGHNVPLLFKKQFRYEGTAFGGGISYGYLLPLSPRWGLEFNIGVGAAYMRYGRYDCAVCGDKIDDFEKVYIGPTRAGITLEFIIK
jgi:hypothetical protein